MENVRCGKCSALLFRAGAGAIQGPIEIKCRRCGTVNFLRPVEPTSERQERRSGDATCRPSAAK
ncbi:Com family DNA-binding transcriptional regulator [Roseixanthobacter finlandensis]|uniref:Com family DNA-binding transcriptional regulator n=1 Tax=Roseixanthobacter finlandensis TaxID=3119922 RepID=UPI00372D86B3